MNANHLTLSDMNEILPDKAYILWGHCVTHGHISGGASFKDAVYDWNIMALRHKAQCGKEYKWLVVWERPTRKVVFPIDYSGLTIDQVSAAALLTGEERLKRLGDTPIKGVKKANPRVPK